MEIQDYLFKNGDNLRIKSKNLHIIEYSFYSILGNFLEQPEQMEQNQAKAHKY